MVDDVISRVELVRRERILTYMEIVRPKGGSRPVLLSELREKVPGFNQDAFDGLVRDGVICAEFPNAKPGDSGLQFWNFAHWTALDRLSPNLEGEK